MKGKNRNNIGPVIILNFLYICKKLTHHKYWMTILVTAHGGDVRSYKYNKIEIIPIIHLKSECTCCKQTDFISKTQTF